MRQLLAIFRQLDLNGDEDLEKGEIIEGLRDNEQLRDYLQQVPKLRFLLQTDAWTKMLFGMETSDSDSVKFGEFYCFAVMIMGFSNTEHILGGEEDDESLHTSEDEEEEKGVVEDADEVQLKHYQHAMYPSFRVFVDHFSSIPYVGEETSRACLREPVPLVACCCCCCCCCCCSCCCCFGIDRATLEREIVLRIRAICSAREVHAQACLVHTSMSYSNSRLRLPLRAFHKL